MPETREKLEFSTNIPVEVTLGKNFKSGEGKWGAWHGWNVYEKGEEKVIFAKDALHDKIKGYGEGTKLTITYAEKKGDSGLYHEWEVVSANGAKPQVTTNGHKPELVYASHPTVRETFNLEAHLSECARIANDLAGLLNLQDDSARQACFATVCIDAQRHNVILGDSKPSEPSGPDDTGRKEALLKGVRSACKLLNDEGYEPPFTQKTLNEFVAEKFEVQTVADLSADDVEYLIQLLSEKLDDFRLNKSMDAEPDDTPF